MPSALEVFGGSEKAICELWRRGNADEEFANARLIAAAPELLAAAQECMDCELGDMACVGSTAPAENALGLLKDAIARAVGANA